jgi:D-xylose transport system substrate-binding protein
MSTGVHMKTGLLGSLIVALTMLLPCLGQGSEKVKIGFILKTMQEQRYQTDKRAFLSKAKALGAIPLFDSSSNNEMVQLSRFENMLAHGVKVIVLQPVNTGTASIFVALAHQKGVKVVGYDSMPMNSPLDVMVMQDSWAVGKLQSEALVKWLKSRKSGKVEGNVALIMGQAGDSNVNFMTQGAVDVLRAKTGLDLVIEETHEGWDPYRAQKTAEELLTKFNNRVEAFICNNDTLAAGIIAALRKRGLDDAERVFVAGADADLANIRAVAQGRQAVDVWKMIVPLAEKAAEVAVKIARNPGKKITEVIKPDRMIDNGAMKVPTIITPVKLVTKNNIDETLIEGGVYTREQIYGKKEE